MGKLQIDETMGLNSVCSFIQITMLIPGNHQKIYLRDKDPQIIVTKDRTQKHSILNIDFLLLLDPCVFLILLNGVLLVQGHFFSSCANKCLGKNVLISVLVLLIFLKILLKGAVLTLSHESLQHSLAFSHFQEEFRSYTWSQLRFEQAFVSFPREG